MLDLAKNDCARLLWLVKTVLEETSVIQIWFFRVPWTEDRAHACRQRKHHEKHTSIPFQGVPDRCFYNDYVQTNTRIRATTKYLVGQSRSWPFDYSHNLEIKGSLSSITYLPNGSVIVRRLQLCVQVIDRKKPQKKPASISRMYVITPLFNEILRFIQLYRATRLGSWLQTKAWLRSWSHSHRFCNLIERKISWNKW